MILVTGASGHLARLVLAELSARGVSAVGGSRAPTHHDRPMDFDDPDSIDLQGISTLVLVSAGYAEDDQVISRHGAAIDSAVRSGVEHIVYTSVTGDGDHLALALAHRATEKMVKDSGLDWTILRNGLYAELFGALLTWTDGRLESAFGDGALSAVPREDLAIAATTVAADPARHRGRTYELVGVPITADDVARRLGVEHRSVTLAGYRERLLQSDELMAFQPPMLTSIASSVRHGFMNGTSPDLVTLLGRPGADALAVAADVAQASSSNV
ncbi:NAD(P)H-binding protein [Aeromicrobium sp. CF3.5]|uniref:NAD(P)H-binding protein n=1 Tax=Aeromicrobium sp. CF3.5 TaxID=3373078 RepID=UPI003EE5C248